MLKVEPARATGAPLEWARNDIDVHNSRIGAEFPKKVVDRRSKLLADRAVHARIGFPIQRRDDADTYTVSVARRYVRPIPPSGSEAQRVRSRASPR